MSFRVTGPKRKALCWLCVVTTEGPGVKVIAKSPNNRTADRSRLVEGLLAVPAVGPMFPPRQQFTPVLFWGRRVKPPMAPFKCRC